jgi:CubicO group peptidase (beta-lactamase class C family)
MRRRRFITTAVLVPSLGASAGPGQAQTVHPRVPASLNALLRPHLSRYALPAIGAAVVRGGVIVAAGAVGVRRAGTDIAVTIDDRFHIGSDTKAMTALLAAMFVEQGALHWDSTVGGVFPELAATMDAGLRGVTLTQLLSHSSGLPSDNDVFGQLLTQSFTQDGLNLNELRYWLVQQASKQKLATQPGTTFAYSNLGYTMVGAMLERTGNASWEELMVARVFDPLRLRTAGFGPQSSLGRVDAPLGHSVRQDGSLKPMLAGPNGDNPAIIGPAGVVHLSILDFATWAGWNAGLGRRGPALVRPETLHKLQSKVIDVPPPPNAVPGTPSRGSYGMGWGIATVPYARDPVVTHDGSNLMNLASVVLQPAQDFGMVLATNVGGTKASEALRSVAGELYAQYGAPR